MPWSDGPSARVRHPRLFRALVASGVGLVVLVVLIPVFALASGSQLDPPPSAFSTAEPWPGDHATYEYRLHQYTPFGTRTHLEVATAVEWTVGDPAWARVPDGSWREAIVVDHRSQQFIHGDGDIPLDVMAPFAGPHYELVSNRLFMEPRGFGPVGGEVEKVVAGSEYKGSDGRTVRDDRWLNTSWWGALDSEALQGRRDLCGITHPLQGRVLSLDEPIILADGCHAAGAPVSATPFQAKGREPLDGRDCVRFEQVEASLGRRATMWLCPEIPYPARVEIDHVEFQDYRSVYTLTAFTRGQGLGSRVDAPTPWSTAPASAAAHPWGPDDADVGFPFKLSDAYHVVESEPNETIRGFFTDNPEAFLRSAHFDLQDLGETEWTLRFQGREEALSLRVTPDGTLDVRRDERGLSFLTWESYVPPNELPTVAGLYDLFRALRPTNSASLEPKAWSVDVWFARGVCEDLRSGQERVMPWNECPLFLRLGADTVSETGSTHEDGSRTTDTVEFDARTDANASFISTWHHHRIVHESLAPAGADGANAGAQQPAIMTAMVTAPDFEPDRRVIWATAIGFVAGAVVFAWPFLKNTTAFLLFSRIERHSALAHPMRQTLFDIIEAEPGIHFQELVRRTGRARAVVEHHLRKLLSVGLVQQELGAGFACYFRSGTIDRRVMQAVPFAKGTGAAGVLDAVASGSADSAIDVAKRLGIDEGTVSYHVKRLRRAGLLTSERDGPHVLLRATDLAPAALALTHPPLAGAAPVPAADRKNP